MAGVQSKLVKLPESLQVSLPANWRKLALISSSLVLTFFLGRYVARKYYVKSISKVLTDETVKHDQARLEKVIRTEHPADEIAVGTVDGDVDLTNQKISFSDPSTPSNHPSGLAQLVESSKTSYRGASLSELSSGRLSTRRRVASSLASTQINLSLRTPEELIIFGNEYLKRALKIWDDTKNRIEDAADEVHVQQLEQIITSTKQLIYDIETYTKSWKKEKERIREIKEKREEEDTESENLSVYASPESSIDSYCTVTYYDVEPNIHFFKLYTKALELDNIVPPRVDRTEMLNCENFKEFTAKVHCLRQAFEQIFKSNKNCDFFTKMGEEILRVLLGNSTKDIDECLKVYHRFIDYVCDKENHGLLEEEIKFRNIPCLNFYDLVIDYIVLDSFEDLDNPPGPVVSVVNNRWFGTVFKISALQRAIEAVLRYKRSKLKVEGGFFTNFYDILQFISPTLAWGFLGSDTDLKLKCNLIKQTIMEVIRDYFDFNRVRYTTLNDLTEDILIVTEIRYDDLKGQLSIFD